MLIEPLNEDQHKALFERCLTNAIEMGMPAMIGAGLDVDAMEAINSVARAYPNATPAQIAAAKRVVS